MLVAGRALTGEGVMMVTVDVCTEAGAVIVTTAGVDRRIVVAGELTASVMTAARAAAEGGI